MEGYTFYLENNGLAVFAKADDVMEGVGAVFERPNSQVASTSCGPVFLDSCMVIPEFAARKIHPNLFVYLDKSGQA